MALARFPGGSAKEPSRDQCFASPAAELKAGAESIPMRNPKADGPYDALDALERDTRTRTAQIARVLHRLK